MSPIIEVRNLSKLYHLGQIGRASLMRSVKHRWRRLRGLPTDDLHSASAHAEIDPERLGPDPNSFWALRDVSFDVNEGEVLGIIGKNGAGKSTLLKILSRITEPSSGYAKMQGRVASLLEVGTGFHADLTGRENVYLNGTILGLKKHEIDARLDEIVDFSGIEKFIDTPVKRYSSGMTVRLAFAVAAHLDPEIMIIDEVLAVGDVAFQRKCVGKMRNVASSGRTVLFVSHQLALISTLCNRCVVLEGGRLVDDCPTEDALAAYTALNATTTTRRVIDGGDGYLLHVEEPEIHMNSGDSLSFSVSVECPVPHEGPSLGFIAYNTFEQPVFGSSSKVQGVPLAGRSTKWRFACDLGGIPLCPAVLKVSFWFGDMNRDYAIFREGVQIHVHSADQYKTGIPLPSSWGHFFWTTGFSATPE